MFRKTLRIVLPLLILAGSVFAFRAMLDSRQPPHKMERVDQGALVRVVPVHRGDRTIVVRGHGEVQPLSEATIAPQVSGRVSELDPRFRAGGFFLKGETFFRVEEVDYELAVEEAEAEVTRTEFELEEVKSKARVARKQWDMLTKSSPLGRRSETLAEAPNPLAFYEPQLKNARAGLEAARAALKRARLDLSRTRLYAPFNCVVRSETVDVGQYVRSGEVVATVMGTDAVEVVVPLSFEELEHLRVARPGTSEKGSSADVILEVGRNTHQWQGRAVRTLGELDTKGRLVRVVVRIDDPYGLKLETEHRPVLAVGTFAEVRLHGERVENVVAVPRAALRGDSSVWLVSEDNRLRIQSVDWVWASDQEVFVTSGLQGGERVVLTTLSGAVEGMALRPVEDQVRMAGHPGREEALP